MTQRMFVAVIPPEEAVEDLDAFLEVRRDATELRWTLPDQWHLTLAFLAEVPDRAVDDLVARLTRAAAKRSAQEACLTGGGAFPHPDRAKVLWAGVELADPVGLGQLATGCRAAAAKAGIAVTGERFRPHLTLARTRRPVSATRWIRILEAYRGPRFTIAETALVASHLGEGPRKRPRYEVLERFALQSA
jgi:RNA 2',3'-cyclic 3'-phosphodiesterase